MNTAMNYKQNCMEVRDGMDEQGCIPDYVTNKHHGSQNLGLPNSQMGGGKL